MRTIQLFSAALIVFVLLNFLLMILGKIKPLFFWINVGVLAIIAFKLVPILEKRSRKS